MEVFLLVVHLLIALALVGIVLLQPSEGGALGAGQGPGGMSGMMQGRSAASALTRATVWLGVAFFATSISLTLLAKSTRTSNPLAPPTSTPTAPAGGLSSIPIPEGGLLGPAPVSTPNPTAPATVPPAAPGASTPLAAPEAAAPAAQPPASQPQPAPAPAP
jgi:preprotein translocase subunit SecG